MKYVVYIIYSDGLNRYYVGETIDLDKRLNEHNEGYYNNSYTSLSNDWKLILSITCHDRIQARKIEGHIKRMKSRKYIEDLVKYPEIIEKLREKY
ncbi:GIY-YIG nuclease family protein [Spongiivirga sp. MCCC 1A20706]|uniref:GIY-YIG nuclease family protein n=1 Tax=Spongiivirga sp. MCCC 1A20706 TaxID=3160963 RepID=UPI0039773473